MCRSVRPTTQVLAPAAPSSIASGFGAARVIHQVSLAQGKGTPPSAMRPVRGMAEPCRLQPPYTFGNPTRTSLCLYLSLYNYQHGGVAVPRFAGVTDRRMRGAGVMPGCMCVAPAHTKATCLSSPCMELASRHQSTMKQPTNYHLVRQSDNACSQPQVALAVGFLDAPPVDVPPNGHKDSGGGGSGGGGGSSNTQPRRRKQAGSLDVVVCAQRLGRCPDERTLRWV
jgi:hypothetical protein